MALILTDLDHFKQVNDARGHDTGEEVLRRVAAAVREHCRAGDLAVRYGGEEFLLALAFVERRAAVEIAEWFCVAVTDHDWRQVSA